MSQGDWLTVGSVVIAIGPMVVGLVWFVRKTVKGE